MYYQLCQSETRFGSCGMDSICHKRQRWIVQTELTAFNQIDSAICSGLGSSTETWFYFQPGSIELWSPVAVAMLNNIRCHWIKSRSVDNPISSQLLAKPFQLAIIITMINIHLFIFWICNFIWCLEFRDQFILTRALFYAHAPVYRRKWISKCPRGKIEHRTWCNNPPKS